MKIVLSKWVKTTIILSGFVLVACNSINPTESESQSDTVEIPVIVADSRIVSDGMLVPKESVDLAFAAGGEVADVLVEEGDDVATGDVIARLSGQEQLESSIAAAKLEVQAAQNELLSAQIARKTLDDDLLMAKTETLDAITQHKESVRTFERRVRSLSSASDQVDIDEAKSAVILAEDALDKAEEAYEPYADKNESNLRRAVLLGNLAVAQRNYDDAVRRLNNLQGVTGDEFDLNQAEVGLQIAQSRLDQAESDYEMYLQGPDPDAVDLAESRIATAEVRLATAESALVAAESALSDLDLVATIDGRVVDLNLTPGEQITPGRPVVTLADFSEWYVETDNLTEIEVVDITLQQEVSIVPDALPEITLSGQVESVKDLFEEKRGDITYTTRILVPEVDPRLRWGMTVVVTFEE